MHIDDQGVGAIVLHTLVDTLPLIPLLFVLYALLEYAYHKRGYDLLARARVSGAFGPLAGTLLGLIPQCGMSVFMTSLYVSGRVTRGTLVATYLATSDEAIPVLMASGGHWHEVLAILGVKTVAGIVGGYGLDLFGGRTTYRGREITETSSHVVDVQVELKQTGVKEVVIHSLRRTARIFLWVFAISTVLGLLFAFGGAGQMVSRLSAHPYLEIPLLALFGLIPNCAASIAIAESYLLGSISFGGAIAGLCAGAGYGPIVLVKDGDKMEAVRLLLITLAFSITTGLVVRLFTAF